MVSLQSELNKALKGNKLGWRQLQQLNNANTPEQTRADDIFKALSSTAGFTSIHSPQYTYSGPTYEPTFESTGKYTDNSWGTSIFDPDVITGRDLENWRDLRAENQPWISKAANGILKMQTLAGTTFISGIAGLIWGGAKAVAEGKFSNIWDNEVTQAMNTINQWSEEVMPNYYTKEEQESPWYTNILSANFIFDKFVKNLGFTVGAALSGGMYTKAISGIAKAYGALRALGKGAEALGASNKVGGILKGLGQAVGNGERAGVARSLMEQGAAAIEATKATRTTKSLVGTFFNAVGEGTVEAVHNGNTWADAKRSELAGKKQQEEMEAAYQYEMQKQSDSTDDPAFIEYIRKMQDIDARYNEAVAQVDIDRKRFGTMDLAMNIPILWAGDWMTFAKFYAGGWKAARTINKTQTRATKQALKDARQAFKNGDKDALKNLDEIVAKAERTGYQGLTIEEKELVEEVSRRGFLQKAWPYVKEPLKEGNEEMAQAAAELASGYYYNKDIDRIFAAENDPESVDSVTEFFRALGQGVKDSYGDVDRWEEGFIGALTGLLGVPTFGRAANNTDQTWIGKGKPIGITGGIVTAVKNAGRNNKATDKAVSHINEVLKNPNRIANFKHLIAQTKLGGDKEKAVISGDKMAFKDAVTASLFEDIMYFKKTDRMDLLQKALENTELFTDADIESIIEQTKSLILPEGPINSLQEEVTELNNNLQNLYQQKAKIETDLQAWTEELNRLSGVEASDVTAQDQQRISELESNIRLAEATLNGNPEQNKDGLNEQISATEDAIQKRQTALDSANNIPYSPFIRNGEMMSPEDIKKDILKRASQVWQVIQDISDAQDEIDDATGEVFSDKQLATLTWYKVMMRDWERRAGHMAFSLKDFIKNALGGKEAEKFMQLLNDSMPEGQQEEDGELNLLGIMIDNYSKNFKAAKSIRENLTSLFDDIDKKIEELSEADDAAFILDNKEESKEDREAAKKARAAERQKNQFGIQLAKLLTEKKEVKIKNQEGEESTEEFGNRLYNAIKAAITLDRKFDEDLKKVFLNTLDDLKRIGEAYREYDKTLKEFRDNPGEIENAQESFLTRMRKKAKKNTMEAKAFLIKRDLVFDGTDAQLAASLKKKAAAIQHFGGLAKFLKYLNEEEREAVKKAARNIEALNVLIKKAEEIDIFNTPDNDDAGDDFNDEQTSLAEALGNFFNDSGVTEGLDTKEDLRKAVLKYLEGKDFDHDTLDEVEKFWPFIEKKVDLSEQEGDGKDVQTEEDEEGEDVPERNTEEEGTDYNDVEDEGADQPETDPVFDGFIENSDGNEYSIFDPLPEAGENRQPGESQKKPNLDSPIRGSYAKTGPSISEFLFGGFLAHPIRDFYRKNKNWIPTELSEEEQEGFLKYIEAVWDYLYVTNNTRENIKQLKEGEEIEFFTDPELNEKAGTQVVLIRNKQTGAVLGSINSKYEMQVYEKRRQRGEIAESPAQNEVKQIFDAVTNAQEGSGVTITRTVNEVLPGDLPRGETEIQVSKAAENQSDNICMGVYARDKGGSLQLIHGDLPEGATVLDPVIDKDKRVSVGQVYWLVKGANNTYIPVLLYSTPVMELMGNTAFMTLFEKELFTHLDNPRNGDLFKLLYLPKSFVHYVKMEGGKTVEVTSKDAATHIKIAITQQDRDDGTTDSKPNRQVRLVKLTNESGHYLSNQEIAKRVLGSPSGGRNSEDGTGILGAYASIVLNKLESGSMKRAQAARMLTVNFDLAKRNDQDYVKEISQYFYSNIQYPYTVNPYFRWELQGQSDNPAVRLDQEKKTYMDNEGREFTYYEEGNGNLIIYAPHKSAYIDPSSPEYQQLKEDIFKSQQQISAQEEANSENLEDQNQNVSQEENINNLPPSRGRGNYLGIDFSTDEFTQGEVKTLSDETAEGEQQVITVEEALQQEYNQITQMFPSLGRQGRIVIHNALNKLAAQGESGRMIYGLTKNGIIVLGQKVLSGILYHESFHYAVDFLLNPSEVKQMFDNLKELYPEIIRSSYSSDLAYQIALEEKGAERFRRFMLGQRDKTIRGRMRNLFRKMKFIIDRIFNRVNYLDVLFYKMYKRQLANRIEQSTAKIGQFQGAVAVHYNNKYRYSNISQEARDLLDARQISRQDFDSLSIEEKEIMLKCMI